MPLILLIEDQPDLRKMLPRVLRSKGHEVITAGTAAEARTALDEALAAGEPPRLVLSDLSLPDGDGVSLSRELLARHPGVTIAFMSGYDSLQASGYNESSAPDLPLLRKPFTLDELFAFVEDRLAAPSPTKG